MNVLTRIAAAAALATATAVAVAVPDGPPRAESPYRAVIVRDDHGIAHVHGHTDADAVYAMMYAQAEDDFNRIESNYLTALGWMARAEGESAIYADLRSRLFADPAELRAHYRRCPPWLRQLATAWAAGLNDFLAAHPAVHPRVIRRFEPWMTLAFSEGSIGGDTERVTLEELKALYAPGDPAPLPPADPRPLEPGGSNGIAIAPARTASGHALLLINPHTSFFFRSELQVTSDQGLNAYGAATWGQFFLYQGFNERLGWMHTSSGVDNVDFFRERIENRGGRLRYRYGTEWRPVQRREIRVAYLARDGREAERSFTVYRTHHGPVIARAGDRFITIALMQRPVEALQQGFLLTKARDRAAFMRAMEFRANSSNNTIYADADGNIAYLHPQFVPRRDDRFDYTHPVDGSDPATDWHGLHALTELPQVLNPPDGWIFNTNNWPYSAAGAASPRAANFPRYMDTAGENPRGLHALALLSQPRTYTADALNELAYDPYLPAMARLIPGLVRGYDALPADDPRCFRLAEAIGTLRSWDYRWAADSVATTLAALWGDAVWERAKRDADDEALSVYDEIDSRLPADEKLAALDDVVARLESDFGTSRVAWGEINRYQRNDGAIVQAFTDAAPSTAIPFTAARWGSLASFAARRYPGTARYYGTSGNSFVAIVEFGERVVARAVSIGGENGDPASSHFADQVDDYAHGRLRRVYFYPADLEGHTERSYVPR